MTGMMMYVAFGLMIFTVISNRYWRRQLAVTRQSISKMKERVDDVSKDLSDVAAEHAQLSQSYMEMENRTSRAEQELQVALAELEQKKAAPTERYYIFDRLEGRSSRFWEVAVRCAPAGPAGWNRGNARGWVGIRRYVLMAETEHEARARVSARFTARQGFEVAELVPCRLNGLLVNRVPEYSTFRRPNGAGDEDPRPSRRASLERRG